ncbi:hypothetical protein [Falsirhodobacter sp. 1013]|uniref:hypothetical protein n=1 Tax=Falsirhodobacter sp. 1013 TaxID=3417566 RepID=UPI003EBDEEE5
MRIIFSPVRSDEVLTLSVTGDILVINGIAVDLRQDTENPWVKGISRDDGLTVTIMLPHGPNPPEAVAFPKAIDVAKDGPVALPSADKA